MGSLADLPFAAFLLVVAGVVVLTLSPLGWIFRHWLRDRTYGDHVILGRVPEGRLDSRGRYRLNFTKLRGTCAIDGSEMMPARVPTQETPLYMTDGTTKTKYSGYELQICCRRLGHKDVRHRGKVDLSDTEG
ncbi:MAG: hypothetical protein LBJ44_08795 [Propionibacteriaceae bacterium]|nr:hypothetical protein [Propionibacteriaceae bacterium]